MTKPNEPQSSDELPQGMKFTRTPVENPYKVDDIQEARAARQARDRATWRKNHDNMRTLATLERLSRGPLDNGRL
jgi:hypothetical protein